MSEHSQRGVKGATAIALRDICVSAMSGKSQSDTSLFSLLLSGGLKLYVDVFQLENQYEPNPLDGCDVLVRLTHQSSDVHLMKCIC